MNKTIVSAMMMLATFASMPQALSQEACDAFSVKPLAANCHDRDKGYKPSTTCTATITAPAGYFILGGDVYSDTEGTTYADPYSESNRPYNNAVIAANPFFKTAILQSSSITARCSRGGGGVGDRTCHAKAKIKGNAYPHSCLKEKLQKILDDLI